MLVSRDEQTCLVVSYKDIKACIESAFGCVLQTQISLYFIGIFRSRVQLRFTALRVVIRLAAFLFSRG